MFMTRLLLGEAEKKPLQYTFLTPQDTSEIKQTDDLTILRFVYWIAIVALCKNFIFHIPFQIGESGSLEGGKSQIVEELQCVYAINNISQ